MRRLHSREIGLGCDSQLVSRRNVESPGSSRVADHRFTSEALEGCSVPPVSEPMGAPAAAWAVVPAGPGGRTAVMALCPTEAIGSSQTWFDALWWATRLSDPKRPSRRRTRTARLTPREVLPAGMLLLDVMKERCTRGVGDVRVFTSSTTQRSRAGSTAPAARTGGSHSTVDVHPARGRPGEDRKSRADGECPFAILEHSLASSRKFVRFRLESTLRF
jgi:hypothetical protein